MSRYFGKQVACKRPFNVNNEKATSKYALEEALEQETDSRVAGHAHTKESQCRSAGYYNLKKPVFSAKDRECAATKKELDPESFSKEEIEEIAEGMGIDTTRMAKIDMCHAINLKGGVPKVDLMQTPGESGSLEAALLGRKKKSVKRCRDKEGRFAKKASCRRRKAKSGKRHARK